MKPMKHQIEAAEKLYNLLQEYGYAYLQGQPRSGKTLTSILVAEMSKAKNIIVFTKKKAIDGWTKFLTSVSKNYTVVNYEQAHKLEPVYDLAIIDESHNIGSFPKRSKRNKEIVRICKNIPHIHLSGTAIVESPASIYHQMHISEYSPFSCKNFYEFHRKWGIPKTIYIGSRQVKDYSQVKPELINYINKFTVYMTQQDAGIDIQVQDVLHYINLDDKTKELYNKLQKDRVVKIKDIEYVADTTMKLRIALHQIEGGTLKLEDGSSIWLGNIEKINYIKEHFNLSKRVGIMCHFKEEQNLIKHHLPQVEVYSSNAHAEGVDLSHLDTFIIYSQDYSGAKHIQRRERIANINGSKTTKVHYLLVKNAISEQVYQAVSKKLDFNNSLYEAKEI